MTPEQIDAAIAKAERNTALTAFENSAVSSIVLARKRGAPLLKWQVELLKKLTGEMQNV